MTIAIVDVLKMIQIELDHRQRPSAALAVAGYRHRLFKQRPAIEQAGQGIMPCLPLQRGLQNAHVADHAADHQPGEQQHQGEEDPHQGQGDGDGAKVPADAFPQSVDPQQHAVKIAQFGPADIARQQTQPSWLSWTNARLSSSCSRGDSRVRTFPGAEEASRFKWLS